MKYILLVLAIAVPTFIIGCQENSITVPVPETQSGFRELSKSEAKQRILILEAVLREPGFFSNAFVEVKGHVSYTATVFPLDPEPPAPQYAVALNMFTYAELHPFGSIEPIWIASGSSEDWVPVPEDGNALLTKRYTVQDRTDGLMLIVQLRISTTSVEVNGMWLELPARASGMVDL